MVNQKQLVLPEEGLKDRIKELQGKIQLRKKDKQVVCAISSQIISENENEIKSLKEELRDMIILEQRMAGPESEMFVISKGLQQCRESQLAFQRLPVHEAINCKKHQFFDKVNTLNSFAHKKVELEKRLQELYDQANYVPPEDIAMSKDFEQKKRMLGAKEDKMKMKAASAKFVEKLYKQIINRLEYDRLEQPKRLQLLEARVKSLRVEINSNLLNTLRDSKRTYKDAKQQQDHVESTFIREKSSRDKSINEMRKKFKNLKIINALEDREVKIRKQKTVLSLAANSAEDEITPMSRMGDDASNQSNCSKLEFQQLREALDELYDKTSVKKLSDVANCLQAQTIKFDDLIATIKALETRKNALMERKDKLGKELESIKLYNQGELHETKQKKADIESQIVTKTELANERRQRFHQLQSLYYSVIEAIDELAVKITLWEHPEVKEVLPEDDRNELDIRNSNQKAKKSKSFIGKTKVEPKVITEMKISASEELPFPHSISNIENLNKLYQCCERLMHITRTASKSALNESTVSLLQELRDMAAHDKSHDILATIQSRNRNSRVSFGMIHNFYMENFLYHDHLDNDEFLSRETIKEMSNSIVEAKKLNVKRKRKG